MKLTKKNVMNLVAKAGLKSAVKAAGVASQYGTHQAQEPKALKK